MQKDSTSREYLKGVLKRYRRKCRKKDMTPQQYQVLLDKEIALEERWPYIFGVITVAVDVFLGVRECMNNTVMDGVILTMIYLISHALVLGFIFRAQHKLLVLRKKMTKEAKECGLTLVDLAIAQEEGNDNP